MGGATIASSLADLQPSFVSPAPKHFARLSELAIVLSGLFFLAPLMLMVSLAVWVQDGGPALYGQLRLGLGGRRFRCLKFRTMFIDSAERLAEILASDPVAHAEWAKDHKLKNDPRVTPVGSFLRKSSLDELPQLVNVLRGDMGLVGPRPIVDAEIPRYGRYFRDYCAVRPGITGLWQVSGRNDVSYRRRVALDVAYSRSKSFALDIRLLAATVPAVLLRKGSY